VLSKRVPILGEGVACNQDPDSPHCKALKRTKSLDELKIKSLAIIRLILIVSQLWNCWSFVLIMVYNKLIIL
jgi:hypothetical protein